MMGLQVRPVLMVLALSALSTPAMAQDSNEISGRWAKLTHLESLSKVPILGEISIETEVISLIEFRPNGSNGVEYREKTCSLRSNTLAGLLHTSYPRGLLRVITKPWTPAEVRSVDGDLVLDLPKAWSAYGYRPEQPGQASPHAAGDPRVIDQDRDGHPGVTVNTGGIVDGQLYAALLEWNESRGRVVSPDRIVGNVDWGTDLAVLGASSSMLRSQAPTRPSPNPDANRFVMRRVPDNATCGALMSRAKALFGEQLALSSQP